MTKNIKDLLNEFESRIEEINGLYIDCDVSIMMYNDSINGGMKNSSNNSTVSMGDGDPNNPNNRVKHKTTLGILRERTKSGGQDFRVITNLCLIAIFQYWEDKYRQELAELLGLDKKDDLKNQLFGEIGIIRRSIVHNRSRKINEFNKIKILNYMINREIVYFSKIEFDELIELIKEEIKKYKAVI